MAEGCDVSEHQGFLPPSFFAQYDFVILRAFNENGYPDKTFAQNWETARGQTRRGVYGWPIPGGNNQALGDQLVRTAPDAEAGYWADVERSGRGLADAGDVEDYLRGIGPQVRGFYANSSECPRSPFLDQEMFWLADYGPNDGRRHDPNEQPPYPPRPYTIHQYTSNPLDKNYTPDLAWLGDDDLNDLERGMLHDVWNRTKDMRDGVPAYGVPPWHDVTAELARIEQKIDALETGSGGLSADDVRRIVRDELNATKLTKS